ncbi:MAG: hypothetical protein WAN30_09345 [Acidimicrobiales bacterium]
MRRLGSGERSTLLDLLFLIVFGIGFGYVEAAVVSYLRALMKFHQNYPLSHYKVWLNLGFITFVQPAHSLLVNRRIADIEVGREAMTIVMLACVGYVAGKVWSQRLGAFLICFACWDISYYGWLRVLDHWPQNLLTRDVFFLIPVTWIGPVITPLVISAVLLALGIFLFRDRPRRRVPRSARFRF